MASNYSPKADDLVAVRGCVFRQDHGRHLAVGFGTGGFENLKDVPVAPWIDPEELRRLRAENESQRETIAFQREREAHFAKVLGIPDGGRYRNDWNATLEVVRKIATLRQQGHISLELAENSTLARLDEACDALDALADLLPTEDRG
jgi:hypothetical protein